MSKISCGGFKIDDETLKFNENEELTVVGGAGGSEGDGSDSVVWFSFSGSNFASAYDSGYWKVGREWQAENENPTPEDILNAYENNKTIRATVYYRACAGLQHCEDTMIGFKFNADDTFAEAYFMGGQNVYMTCIPYTKQ